MISPQVTVSRARSGHYWHGRSWWLLMLKEVLLIQTLACSVLNCFSHVLAGICKTSGAEMLFYLTKIQIPVHLQQSHDRLTAVERLPEMLGQNSSPAQPFWIAHISATVHCEQYILLFLCYISMKFCWMLLKNCYTPNHMWGSFV